MKQKKFSGGMTLVEVAISIAAVSTIAIAITVFMYQTLVSRDKSLALSEATEVASTVLNRIKSSVPGATDLDITANGTSLSIQGDSKCEEFTLVSGRINYETANTTCPINVPQSAITNSSANVTNASTPAITLFTGSPAATDALTVTTSIRVQVKRPFGTSEITLRDSVSRRR